MGLRWSGCFIGFVCVCRVDGSRLVPGFFLFVRVVGSFQIFLGLADGCGGATEASISFLISRMAV